MFGNLGAGEIILILLVILILFGAKKIPELAKGLGKGMSEFKMRWTSLGRRFVRCASSVTPMLGRLRNSPKMRQTLVTVVAGFMARAHLVRIAPRGPATIEVSLIFRETLVNDGVITSAAV